MSNVGIIGSGNLVGHNVVSSASNSLNSSYAVTLSTGSTLSVNGVTLNKIAPSTSNSAASVVPTLASGVMTFSGTQSMIYGYNATMHTTSPYSIQFDFMTTDITKATQYMVNLGEGYGIGWPEWSFVLGNARMVVNTNSNNGTGIAVYDFTNNIVANRWYRVGLMFYKINTQNYVRLYFNNAMVFNRAIAVAGGSGTAYISPQSLTSITAAGDAMPYTTSNGLSLGNDSNNYSGRFFYGSLRNLFIGKTNFWTI